MSSVESGMRRIVAPGFSEYRQKSGPGRTNKDLIPPENYQRIQLDRTYKYVNLLYASAYGADVTPQNAAAHIAMRRGEVDLLDIGCGTGRTLYTWGNEVANQTNLPRNRIHMTGVNKYDYRLESMDDNTNRAVHQGTLHYLVEDARAMGSVANQSQDVIIANYSLLQAEAPETWIPQMDRVLRGGGILFFDAGDEQTHDDKPLLSALEELEDRDYEAHAKILTVGNTSKQVVRFLFVMQAPARKVA